MGWLGGSPDKFSILGSISILWTFGGAVNILWKIIHFHRRVYVLTIKGIEGLFYKTRSMMEVGWRV